MQTEQIHAAALAHGVQEQALEQVTVKVQAHFAGRNPPPADVEAYISGLYVWEKLGMDQATFDRMPVTWRKTQGQAFQPQQVHSRRPVTRDLTPEELTALDEETAREHLTGPERTERARQMQQTPLPDKG